MAKSFVLLVSLRFYYGRNQYFFLILLRLRPLKLITKTCFQARLICVQYFFSHAHYAEIKGTFVSEDISLD